MELLPRSDRTFGAEWLRSALAPTIVFLTIPAVNDFYWRLQFLLPLPTFVRMVAHTRAPLHEVGESEADSPILGTSVRHWMSRPRRGACSGITVLIVHRRRDLPPFTR